MGLGGRSSPEWAPTPTERASPRLTKFHLVLRPQAGLLALAQLGCANVDIVQYDMRPSAHASKDR